jgi:hypothetical protein
MSNSALRWARWPELQKERVRKEIALRLGKDLIDDRLDVIKAALYELYPYAEHNAEYNRLVYEIYTDIRNGRAI